MTTIHHTPPPGATPFVLYGDLADQEPPSPSIVYDEEPSFTSETSLPDPEAAIESIEQQDELLDEPEPYISSYTSRPSILSNAQSRRISGITTTSFISSLPSEVSVASKLVPPTIHDAETTYTPRRERPPFRNPSSVRAMQMSSPPPLASYDSPRERLKGSYKLATPSRSGRSETPVSNSGRSLSQRRSRRRDSQAQMAQSPRPTPTPQQHLPLVLLHVTILPVVVPYPHELMAKVMPDWLLENYRFLGEKLEDIVLMRRGLLIPHPRDEYEVLEERVLESLELQTPRLLKCGHFVAPYGNEDTDDESEIDDISVDDAGRGSRMSGGTITADENGDLQYSGLGVDDASVCTDCHRQVKKPGRGLGVGTKRWDIKIYAANGLMRAGAWCAAWKEMERCDVEISPWVPEDVRRAIEKKLEEEHENEKLKQAYQAELQRRIEEEKSELKRLDQEAEAKRKREEAELMERLEAEKEARLRQLTEDRKIEETLHEKIEQAKESLRLDFEAQALAQSEIVTERLLALEEKVKATEVSSRPPVPEMPDQPELVDKHWENSARGHPRPSSREPALGQVPLGTLLKNYLVLTAQDRRNVAILFLSMITIFLAMHAGPTSNLPWTLANTTVESINNSVSAAFQHNAPVMSMTTTATVTTTAVERSTVTQIEYRTSSTLPISCSEPSPSMATEAVSPQIEEESLRMRGDPQELMADHNDNDIAKAAKDSPHMNDQPSSAIVEDAPEVIEEDQAAASVSPLSLATTTNMMSKIEIPSFAEASLETSPAVPALSLESYSPNPVAPPVAPRLQSDDYPSLESDA